MRNVNEVRKEAVVEAWNAKHDGDVVEPGKIAAQDQRDLKRDGNCARPVAERRGDEVEPRHDELTEVIEQHAGFVKPTRCMMQIPAQRIWQRLRFVMIKKAGEIAP